MDEHTTSRLRRKIAAAGIAAAVALTVPGLAQGHGVTNFWQYRPDVRKTSWRAQPTFEKRHRHFHRNVQRREGAMRPSRHRSWHHSHLVHAYRQAHYYRRVAKQSGEAAWYTGETGACGKPLTGMYAAHKTWPCGSLVSVKHGSRYVFVRILDRGPYTEGRVIDLSPAAFNRLGDTSSGTMDVRIFRIKRDR